MDPHTYIFKIKHGDVLRRITVRAPYDIRYGLHGEGPDITFSQLESTIREAFSIPIASKVSIVYTDKDNDEVTMVDDNDIQDACVYQKLNPVRVRVLLREELQSSMYDARPSESLAVDPPPWADDILMKLDQLLLAVNKPLIEPGVASVIPASTKTEDHVVDVDDSPINGSTIKAAKDGSSLNLRVDSASSGFDSDFLRRAAILRQRGMTDDLE
ncbi:hypothetical protein KC19_2G128200 [Ceratodon purpureus]|uniref:PB1 domain-containing protein n=1 Tax=Ceratodon purpureus TaxID=3225 RepID=A0A8T0IVE5_CERPU|nr:hypothetical protein KC19_2G128200 [Ceratodon purpureus]